MIAAEIGRRWTGADIRFAPAFFQCSLDARVSKSPFPGSRASLPSTANRIVFAPSLRMWFWMEGKQLALGVKIRRLLEVRGQGCPRSGYWWILDRCRASWTRFEGCHSGCGFGWMGSNWPLVWKFVGCSKQKGLRGQGCPRSGYWWILD